MELFLDMRDLAKEMIVSREINKMIVETVPDDIPEDIDDLNMHIR